jgi:hypothetical protein
MFPLAPRGARAGCGSEGVHAVGSGQRQNDGRKEGTGAAMIEWKRTRLRDASLKIGQELPRTAIEFLSHS